MQKCALVLGMHRSGTSTAAAATMAAGFEFGSARQVSDEDNPRGYFENFDITRLNDQLLWTARSSWDVPGFSQSIDWVGKEFVRFETEALALLEKYYRDMPRWLLKDPRMCLTLPFWQRLIKRGGFGDTYYVVILRDPVEVAISQQKRHWSNPDFHVLGRDVRYTYALWYAYYRDLAGAIDHNRTILIDYASLIEQPHQELLRLAAFLGTKSDANRMNWFELEFVDRRLRRSAVGDGNNPIASRPFEFVSEIHRRLLSFADRPSVEAATLRSVFGGISPPESAESYKAAVDGFIATTVEPGGGLFGKFNELRRLRTEISKERNLLASKERNLLASARELSQLRREAIAGGPLQTLTKGFSRTLRRRGQALECLRLLRGEGGVDADWYLRVNPDVAESGMEPAFHYFVYGAYEGRDPNPHFSTLEYVSKNSSVLCSGMDPLSHFLSIDKSREFSKPPMNSKEEPNVF